MDSADVAVVGGRSLLLGGPQVRDEAGTLPHHALGEQGSGRGRAGPLWPHGPGLHHLPIHRTIGQDLLGVK